MAFVIPDLIPDDEAEVLGELSFEAPEMARLMKFVIPALSRDPFQIVDGLGLIPLPTWRLTGLGMDPGSSPGRRS